MIIVLCLIMRSVAAAGLQSALTAALTGVGQTNANKAFIAPVAGAELLSSRVAGPYLEYDPASEKLSVVVPALVFAYGSSLSIGGNIYSIYDINLDGRLAAPSLSDAETRVFYWPFGTLPLTERRVASEFTTAGKLIVWSPPVIGDAVDSLLSPPFVNRVAAAVLSFGPIQESILYENGVEHPISLVQFNNYVRYANYDGVAAYDRSMPLYVVAEPEPHLLLICGAVLYPHRRRRT